MGGRVDRWLRSGIAAGVAFVALGSVIALPATADTITRTSSFAYDATTGFLVQEVVEPDDPAYRLQTDYARDAYGNSLQATVTGADIATRSSQQSFDSTGRFAVSATNALGHQETRSFRADIGEPVSLTGPNGLTTQWQYDSFGRKTLETRADGTRTAYSYEFCSGVQGGSALCPTGAVYVVTEQPQDSSGNANASYTRGYFDKLERQIRAETQGFDSTAVYVDTEFDALGRAVRVTRPYYAGEAPVWLETAYDALGRTVLEINADGAATRHLYDGLTTTVINELGQSRTTVKDSQGNVVEVSDAIEGLTSYSYDAAGSLTATTDPSGNVMTASFDLRGRRVLSNDPDLGSTSFTYNVLGELVSQTDAKSQTISYSYDLLGRVLTRVDPDQTTTWTYDTANKGIGKPTAVATDDGHGRIYSYDSLGRPSSLAVTIGGQAMGSFVYGYDSDGRLQTTVYPTPQLLTVRNVYNAVGALAEVRRDGDGSLIWKAEAVAADSQLLGERFGNDVATTHHYDIRGWHTGVRSRSPGATSDDVQSLGYSYDAIGNLANRTDSIVGLEESFQYDALNRLTEYEVAGQSAKTVTYDAVGNITYKSDVGTYSYAPAGGALPHAVASTTGTVNASFTYDAKGNLLSGNGRILTWTAFDKPGTIERGGQTLIFSYGPERQRVIQSAPGTMTYYLGLSASAHLEKSVDAITGLARYEALIHAGGTTVATLYEIEEAAGGGATTYTTMTRYLHADNLGSISVITDELGQVVERLSYDPWGKRRFTDGADDTQETITSLTNRGFTQHEHLEEVALVHMNGRVYDPLIGRFLSPDPHIPDLMNAQAFNPYSYVLNNPLAYVDPSGFFFGFIGRIISGVVNVIVDAVSEVVDLAVDVVSEVVEVVQENQIGQVALAAGIVALTGPGGALALSASSYLPAAVLSSTVVGGITGGAKGAILGGATAAVTFGIGSALPGEQLLIQRAVVHSAFRGGLAAAQGGDFKLAALSTGLSVIGGDYALKTTGKNVIAGFAASSVVGGTASLVGGGKFLNGAATAAFVNLHNATAHLRIWVTIPEPLADALNGISEFLGGRADHFGTGLALGGAIQYTGPYDILSGQTVPFDYTGFITGSAPANIDTNIPHTPKSLSASIGFGLEATETWTGTFESFAGQGREITIDVPTRRGFSVGSRVLLDASGTPIGAGVRISPSAVGVSINDTVTYITDDEDDD